MTNLSNTVRVFISSTFPPAPRLRWTNRDRHAERDHLVTVVFPELRERVEQVGLEFFSEKQKESCIMKNSTCVLVALLLCLCGVGCSAVPKRVEVSPVTRYIPVDKVYYIPCAFGSGVANSFLWAFDQPGLLTIPLNLTEGLIFTTFDTSVNIVCWLPLEGFEMVTGKTWERPFMGSYSGGLYGGWLYESHNTEPEATPNTVEPNAKP